MALWPLSTRTATGIDPGGFRAGATVKNVGSQIAYLGTDSTVTPVNGYALSAGSSVIWDAQRPLWGLAEPAGPTTVSVYENIGNLFDASAIAQALLSGGLANQIASAISISGAPPIDVNAILLDTTLACTAAGSVTTAAIDVTKYQSVTLWIQDAGQLMPLGANRNRAVYLVWSTPGASLGSEAFGLTDQGSAVTSVPTYGLYRAPVRGATLQVAVYGNGLGNSNVRLIVVGSYKALSKSTYMLSEGQFQLVTGTGAPANVLGSAEQGFASVALPPTFTTGDFFVPLPSRSGTALLQIRNITTLTNLVFQLFNAAGGRLMPATTLGANAVQYQTLTLPPNGLVARFTVASAIPAGTTEYGMTLTFDED